MAQALTRSQTEEIIQEWIDTLNSLYNQVEEWVATEGWTCEREEVEIEEGYLGKYMAPSMTITTPEGDLFMEPYARIVIGGKGTVRFYAIPTLRRVKLLKEMRELPRSVSIGSRPKTTLSPLSEEWTVLTDSGIKLRQSWSCANFIILVNDLLGIE